MRNQPHIEVDPRAIERFVDAFITAQRRERARKLLLGKYEQRIQALQALPEWMNATVNTQELRGAAPAELAKHADVHGWFLDDKSFERAQLRDVPISGGFGALFVSEDGQFALIVPEVGNVLLCRLTKI